jgi:hypothetical protein
MSRAGQTRISGDRTPPTGVDRPPSGVLRPVPGLEVAAPADWLTRHIARLFALHEGVRLKFGGIDLGTLDDAAKRALLDDIDRALGIRPMNPPGG